jgi:hypothetical protein
LCAALPAHAKKAERPLIERTVIAYPKAIGAYTLDSANFDPKNFSSGLALRYAAADAPLRLDVYVYPLGRGDREEALAAGMSEIEGAIRELEQKGTYQDVHFGAITEYSVPWSDAAPVPAAGVEAADSDAADKDDEAANAILALIGETGPPATVSGRRRGLQLVNDGEPLQSLAYLFYRQLYLVKVRASAPLAAGSQPAFEAAVDRAVTTLVPALRIANDGGCGDSQINVPSDGTEKQQSDALLRGLGETMARLEREGCGDFDEATLPAGYATQEIRFPADAWKSQ